MLIRDAIISPGSIQYWEELQWDIFIQQGYVTELLARLYFIFERNNVLDYIPEYVMHHFTSSTIFFQAHLDDVQREVSIINQALQPSGIIPVFLKGTAYIVNKDQAYLGRLFSDIDILVPKSKIEMVEKMFLWQGWVSGDNDDYDENYYRQWMHEIPPLVHPSRGITLDIHHNIVPLIGRYALKESDFNVENIGNTLRNEDKILHSAVHLLTSGEFHHGFRDLSDLYLLINEFLNRDKNFVNNLLNRAKELGLERILFYCFRYLNLIFEYEIVETEQKYRDYSPPNKLLILVMDFCFVRVLKPHHESCQDQWLPTASLLLFLRSHWLLMPMKVLIPHLTRKAWKGLMNNKE